MASSQSRECIVSPTNELRQAVSVIDMNNYNSERSFEFDDEPQMVKLDINDQKVHRGRRELQPLSENFLNMFACLVAAAIGALAVIGLVITFIVLAMK